MKASVVQPALIGGVVAGLLSALPIVSAGNFCCCLWIVSGGLVAAYVLQQNQAAPITPADGTLAGLAAGVVAAFVYLVVSIPINILVGPMERMVFERLSQTMSNMPPEFRQYAETRLSPAVRAVLGFMFMLVLGVIFSTLGGLLGGVIFAKKAPPVMPDAPGTIDIPPPA